MNHRTVEHEGGFFNRRRAERVQRVLHFLGDHHTTEPFPAMSDHHRQPEEPEVNLNGYAEMADIVLERTEISQLANTAIHGWDSNGEYR